MKSLRIKLPLVIALCWAVFSFILSEVLFQAGVHIQDNGWDRNGTFIEPLYSLSDTINWPFASLYENAERNLYREQLEDMKQQGTGDAAQVDAYLAELNAEGQDYNAFAMWGFFEQHGYQGFVSESKVYALKGVASLISAGILLVAAFIVINLYQRLRGQTAAEPASPPAPQAGQPLIKNRVKIGSFVTVVSVHYAIFMYTAGISLALELILGSITYLLLKSEEKKARTHRDRFHLNNPFHYFGTVYGEFQHVYYHDTSLEQELYSSIKRDMENRTPVQGTRMLEIQDRDRALRSPQTKCFMVSEPVCTATGTEVTLVLNQESFNQMRSIRWRVLASGYVDNNKKFNFIGYAFVTAFFWLIPYLRHRFDLLNKVRTIHPGSFNIEDLELRIKGLHEAVFESMITEFERNDIDTSELKTQKAQVMNITVSGGKLKIGNILQGAANSFARQRKGVNA